MGTNMQRFGETLTDRMKKTARAANQVSHELGTINANLSLTTDSLNSPIPRGAYMVNLMMTGTFRTSADSHSHSGGAHKHEGVEQQGEDGEHAHSGGSHSHALPSSFRGLKGGDRVLVVWCGNEPVVVAVVVDS